MTTPLAVTRAQLRALVAVAKGTDCTIEVEVDGKIYRVIPKNAQPEREQPPNLDIWKDARL